MEKSTQNMKFTIPLLVSLALAQGSLMDQINQQRAANRERHGGQRPSLVDILRDGERNGREAARNHQSGRGNGRDHVRNPSHSESEQPVSHDHSPDIMAEGAAAQHGFDASNQSQAAPPPPAEHAVGGASHGGNPQEGPAPVIEHPVG